MGEQARPPASRPCGSCPYRRDVPSGVWALSEYRKLPLYDDETGDQPPGVFLCHRHDGRVCAGWAGCHDGTHLLAVRIGVMIGTITVETAEAICDYVSPVPLFASGFDAAVHGVRDLQLPGGRAQRVIDGLTRARDRRREATERQER